MRDIYQLTDGSYIEPKITEYGQYFVYSDFSNSEGINPDIMSAYVAAPEHKIPLYEWNQMVSFFMYWYNQSLEVQARFYKRNNEFLCCVPVQQVAGGSVIYDYTKPIYSLDGHEWSLKSLVEAGWIAYGHFHLHPFDMANPSATDDANELKDPLLYGIVSIPTDATDKQYRICTTIVANNGCVTNKRYNVDSFDIIDFSTNNTVQSYQEVPFSSKCIGQVSRFVAPKVYNYNMQKAITVIKPTITSYTITLEKEIDWLLQKFSKEQIIQELKKRNDDFFTTDELFTYDNYDDPFYFRDF